MAGDSTQNVSPRGKRVRRLKKLIVMTVLALMLLPLAGCIVMSVQVYRLNARMDRLSEQLAGLEQTLREQSSRTGQLSSEAGTGILVNKGQGEAPDADSRPENMHDVGAFSAQQYGDGEAEEAGTGEQSDGTVDRKEAKYKVYLTFDDGPSAHTDEILDILAEYDVKATFFVVGKQDDASKAAIRRIAAEGHTLGMHSYNHRYAELYASNESFAEDVKMIQNYLYELTGVESRFYRFPGGSSNRVSRVSTEDLADYLDNSGITFFDWNVSSGDAGSRQLSAEALIKNCMNGLGRWETTVILMHDSADKTTTLKALPDLIEKILALEDTVILPITEDTTLVQHIERKNKAEDTK